MVLTDPISDMITIIRNGLASNKKEVRVPNSKLKQEILKILKKEHFVEDFSVEKDKEKSALIVSLRYVNNKPTISNIKRISKPGRRIYAGKSDIPYVKGKSGLALISTSKGVLSGNEAREQAVGGEILIEVW